MVRAWFEYKGINSIDKYIHIENDISFASPEADVELIEVLGRDGELAINNNRFKGVDFSFPIRLKLPPNKTIEEVSTEISEWLKNDIGWFPLRFSGSPEYEYSAICYEQFNIQETLRQYGRTVINFRLKPYKRRINSKTEEINNGSILYNPENRNSKPKIKIEGSGSVTLQNNGKDWLIVNSVDGHIIIDSDTMSVYKDNENQFNKIYGELSPLFPVLKPGQNKITWTGNVSKIEIEPRWEAVL